jgi:threonine dehydrogenase-like Zn-dependent dehydrogenase
VTALEWLADRRLVVAPLITHRLPPDAIQAAYAGLAERRDEYLGVVLQWQ